MTQDVLGQIREELRANSDPATRNSGERFFKESVRLYGVKTAVVTGIARAYLREVKPQGKERVFALCERLWQSGMLEESFIACEWSHAFSREFTAADFVTFERWLSEYVSNWASCDTLCNHTIGTLVETYPDLVDSLKTWARSENRWMRRGAAVTLIIPARHGKFLEHIFDIAGILLLDGDDLVQKGYGWMLKAASEAHRDDVFDFVTRHKGTMPRTALRYAIEKMPAELRAQAMAR